MKTMPLFTQKKNSGLLESTRTEIGHIEFTSRCNLSCVYCASSQPTYDGNSDLDSGTIDHVIESLKKRNIQTICVSGHGETTIYKDWHLYCDKLLDSYIKLHIQSNFAKDLSYEETKTLSRFNTIEVSCDTADPKLFRKLRRGGDFKTLCLNMAKVRAVAIEEGRKPPIFFWSCVVTDKNVFSLMEYVSLGIAMGVKSFNFCNLTKYPDIDGALSVKHITSMSGDSLRKAFASLTNVFDFLHRSNIPYSCQAGLIDTLEEELTSAHANLPPSDRDSKGNVIKRYSSSQHDGQTRDCLDPWKFVLVKANKRIFPCCWYYEPIGSLDNGHTLEEALNSYEVKTLRESLIRGDLSKCCADCPSRGWTTTKELRKKVESFLKMRLVDYRIFDNFISRYFWKLWANKR
jgi:MoaA/NifB/PqqE/SkfB family radical SAM enzyme